MNNKINPIIFFYMLSSITSNYAMQIAEIVNSETSHLPNEIIAARLFLEQIYLYKQYTQQGNQDPAEPKRNKTHNKIYSCRFCAKTFSYLSRLTRHERTHTGIKPFICTFCNKTFSAPSHLKEHERIHTGVKPFACKLCKKTFSQSGNLKAHERIKHAQKRYSIDFICR